MPNLSENTFEEYIDSSEIDVSHLDKKGDLPSKIWSDKKLNPRVRLKLLDIADTFWYSLNIDYVEVKDIIITGSICNYNWTKFSDIDLHILIDYNEVDENTEFVRDYLFAKKNEWNQEHVGLKIYGFPVELYVQDINEEHPSSGVYSIETNEWLVEPNKKNIEALSINDKSIIKEKSALLMNIIDNMEEKYYNNQNNSVFLRKLYKDISKLFDKIRYMRKVGLSDSGEMNYKNIIYKVLRQTDYLNKLYKLKITIFDYVNSID